MFEISVKHSMLFYKLITVAKDMQKMRKYKKNPDARIEPRTSRVSSGSLNQLDRRATVIITRKMPRNVSNIFCLSISGKLLNSKSR